MGLTIHYSFAVEDVDEARALSLLNDLHRRASELPFDSVDEILEFDRSEIVRGQEDGDGVTRWMLIQAGNFLEHDGQYFNVTPNRVIAFSTNPGPGCEVANFGLCRFPKTIDANGHTLPTNLPGWQWSSFCKTQYASNPDDGGLKNFLRCHTTLVQLLDYANELGMLNSVMDESDYWEHRDVAALARVVGNWNEMIAGFVGGLKDEANVEAPITEFPDFEYLEARGRDEHRTDRD